ncbi:4-hydroxy-tetrahydrodipicolinate synthase [Tichowtungia aerotolerans]|uniref:4-hydroxy-tetrahydrodipicolinate synthase n=1 Tax=Tichowtungia aerotolerans TaxID=2697043 RepID=A0A6P1MGZ5_9BACT|nr:4-hydroxy-tetrahydrodipicolinate synthase [Tichowtungia aerotolerans]
MLKGAHTAIITPFNADESVDYGKLRELIDFQIENGIDGIVPVGTTGESPTLNTQEHMKVIEQTVHLVNGRAKVIAGTGANSTAEALELTAQAKDLGIDATLQVTPYYNKPNQEGLYRHFSAVADLGVPVVLYNVPGRSSREIAIETVARLAKHPKVVAVKEAGGDVARVKQTLDACSIEVLSGDDGLALPMMRDGATGLISVASNVVPGVVATLVHTALDGQWNAAQLLHDRYLPLFDAMFVDTNPIPVKAALAMMGKTKEVYRLPLCSMEDALKEELKKVMTDLELL